MGYISIQINKAKGSADTGASDHIERKTMPKNADPTRTHLNRELVEFSTVNWWSSPTVWQTAPKR